MKVESLKHLKELASSKNGDLEEFYILIANGLARSSKRISYNFEEDKFSIIHEVDESYLECSSIELGTKTNFIKAIYKGSLYKYSD